MSKADKKPLVTVVVVPRESFNDYGRMVQRMIDVTTISYKMILMEGHAPKKNRQELEAIAAKYDHVDIVYSDRWKFPHDFVNEIMPKIETKYACFIDNDVEVLEGWLENLVETAEKTGAGCVHPIYLTVKLSDPERTIHIAEGKFYKEQKGDKWIIDTIACYSGVPLEEYPYTEPHHSDFFEWHCVMFTKDLLDKVGPLDDLNIAEHMDYSLRITEAGEKILVVPKSVVAYDYARIWELRGLDRKYLLYRWDLDKAITSDKRLHAKWNLDPISTERRIYFAKEHTAKVRSMNLMTRSINKLRRMAGMQNLPIHVGPKPESPVYKVQEDLLASAERKAETK